MGYLIVLLKLFRADSRKSPWKHLTRPAEEQARLAEQRQPGRELAAAS
jgi:hypothetical protein